MSPTPRQADLLRFISGYIEAKGCAPSFAEMTNGAQTGGNQRTTEMLIALEERGHIRRIPTKMRAIEVLSAPPIPRAPDGAPLYAAPLLQHALREAA